MKNVRHRFVTFFLVVAMSALIIGFTVPATAAGTSAQQGLVDAARVTFNDFMRAESMSWVRDHLHEVKALLIIPSLLRGGFIIGGSGGRGVLVVKDSATGQWSQPAFYSIGSFLFGLMIGGEAAEVLMLVRTQEAVDKLLASSFKFGGDLTITVGPIGGGAKSTIMADIYSFALSKGLYVGVSMEGAVVTTRDDWNTAYYGRAVTPADIFILHSVSNPGSAELRETVAQAAVVKQK
ncbi:MAG: lipid-binding SYLF domain-containing protein [Desulfobacterales bacterium]